VSNPDKVVLITGASSGFGAAIAEALAAKSYRVFGTARSLRAAPSDVYTTLSLDVTREDSF
jgi:NADP-dependent 3-hydroxy acid dehydrogenase YdfG